MNSKIALTIAAIVPFGFVLLALAALAHFAWKQHKLAEARALSRGSSALPR